jgi:hypothetical protein
MRVFFTVAGGFGSQPGIARSRIQRAGQRSRMLDCAGQRSKVRAKCHPRQVGQSEPVDFRRQQLDGRITHAARLAIARRIDSVFLPSMSQCAGSEGIGLRQTPWPLSRTNSAVISASAKVLCPANASVTGRDAAIRSSPSTTDMGSPSSSSSKAAEEGLHRPRLSSRTTWSGGTRLQRRADGGMLGSSGKAAAGQ